MNSKIKVLIVDDHPFFRQGVSFFLNDTKGIELVGEVSSCEEALDIVTSVEVDVMLMDLQMTGMDGIATTRALLEKNPSLRILILTSFGGGEKIQQALRTDAAGYCLKDAPLQELLTVIKAVAETLFIGEKTVKTHVANALHKLGVKIRTQAAFLANKEKLFQEENA
ncbi:MAG: response regulator transcription factor [Clostridiaceae bacterium]|nr:response regulator transcription factor [Clostridiaceae bacterium]